jgi:hypothetical protein
MKIELRYPLERDGSFVRSIVLRQATLNDYLGTLGSTPTEYLLQMLAILSDLSEELIDEMDVSDLLAALNAVATMLRDSTSPPTMRKPK